MIYDFVVVGSGPGGSVFAATAAARGARVLVVEEGPAVAAGEVAPYTRAQMRRQYRNQGLTVALGRPSVAYTEARCVGGGSEVNSGLYHAPSAELLDRWRISHRIEGLDHEGLAEHVSAVERRLQLTETPHPSDPLPDGAAKLGWHGLTVPRWVGPGEGRRSMSSTYLSEALRDGAQLRAEARVDRLAVERGRVRGVRIGAETVRADRVVVAAGAIGSPALLQRSGLGHGTARRGRFANRPIGSGLSMHPTVKAVASFAEEVNLPGEVSPYQIKQWGDRLSLGHSASRPGLLGIALADNDPGLAARAVTQWPHLGVWYAAIRSHGTGWVRSVPGTADPLVGYRITRSDLEALRAGLGRLLLVLLAAGAREVIASVPGAPVVRTPADIPAAVAALDRRVPLMSVHLTGTLAMGERLDRCAVDSFGRLHGTDGVWVSDASMLPDAPGINPQGTLMAIARRNAHRLLEDGS